MMSSLWGAEFDTVITSAKTKKTIAKISKPKSVTTVCKSCVDTAAIKQMSLIERLSYIKTNVENRLGRYAEDTICITSKKDLDEYIHAAVKNGFIAVDTETNNSLDPLTCKIMGLCLYTPEQKNLYVPINHIDSTTHERLQPQLTEQDIKEELLKIVDSGTKIITHNGKFDYEVLKCTCDISIPIYWDTMVGAKILDENDKSAGLKQQYISKIDCSIEKYSIEDLFEKVEYAVVPYDLFALYAATDAYMTYKLYMWQKEQFEKPDNSKLLFLFQEIEMPIVVVTAEMELTGICIDKEYAKRLSNKYNKKLSQVNAAIEIEIGKLKDKIAAWRLTPEANFHERVYNTEPVRYYKSKAEQLPAEVDQINVGSVTQLAILLYDIIGVSSPDSKHPRGTGEDILSSINHPLCSLVLEKRGLEKLIGTYIDKLPAIVNPETGRLYAKFNTLGAQTGRFSSVDPNLQNIPSHEKFIRLMFTAQPGYKLVSSDFSQQEPRLLSHYSQDANMIAAYKAGKDLYATIAAGVYHNKYEDNLEHNPDGSFNPEGKKRRSNVKSLLLGLMYGRGVTSIAEQIKGTYQEAQKITNDFFNAYPNVKQWIEKTKQDAYKVGYVEDICGRRRRLPDIQLPKYSAKPLKADTTFNPIIGCDAKFNNKMDKLLRGYVEAAENTKSRQEYTALKNKAMSEGVVLTDNSGFIADAERQSVNARVQGGAATLSKWAMICIHNDPELRKYGFRMQICVHDEIIGECKEEYANRCAKRLTEVMIESASRFCSVPMKCDSSIVDSWYEDEVESVLLEEGRELLKTQTPDEAFQSILHNHEELSDAQLHKFIDCVLYR